MRRIWLLSHHPGPPRTRICDDCGDTSIAVSVRVVPTVTVAASDVTAGIAGSDSDRNRDERLLLDAFSTAGSVTMPDESGVSVAPAAVFTPCTGAAGMAGRVTTPSTAASVAPEESFTPDSFPASAEFTVAVSAFAASPAV